VSQCLAVCLEHVYLSYNLWHLVKKLFSTSLFAFLSLFTEFLDETLMS